MARKKSQKGDKELKLPVLNNTIPERDTSGGVGADAPPLTRSVNSIMIANRLTLLTGQWSIVQKDIARRTGPPSTLSLVFTAQINLSTKYMARIADFFMVSLDWLVWGDAHSNRLLPAGRLLNKYTSMIALRYVLLNANRKKQYYTIITTLAADNIAAKPQKSDSAPVGHIWHSAVPVLYIPQDATLMQAIVHLDNRWARSLLKDIPNKKVQYK